MEEGYSPTHFLLAGHIVIDKIIDSKNENTTRESLGGALSYSSICLRSLGCGTEIITRIGEDFPLEYSLFLRDKGGIDVEKWRTRGYKTTSYEIDRSVDPRKLRLASKCKDLDIRDFSLYAGNYYRDYALIVGTVAGEISLELLERISKEFDLVFIDSQGFVRTFEYDGRVSMNSGLNISSLSGVDFLKAEVDEILAWTGSAQKDEAIQQLSTFVPNILTTSGPGSVDFYENGELTLSATPPSATVADTTGAGDIMLSSFAARYSDTRDAKDSLTFSMAAASLAIRKIGIEKAILTKSEILDEMKHVKVND